MLYDPRWEKQTETKANPLSLKTLIAWLESMPADGSYDFHDRKGMCMVGQYMAAVGVPWNNGVRYGEFSDAFVMPDGVSIACHCPRTFGDALKRARKALAAQ